jgi:hypothetical protein
MERAVPQASCLAECLSSSELPPHRRAAPSCSLRFSVSRDSTGPQDVWKLAPHQRVPQAPLGTLWDTGALLSPGIQPASRRSVA